MFRPTRTWFRIYESQFTGEKLCAFFRNSSAVEKLIWLHIEVTISSEKTMWQVEDEETLARRRMLTNRSDLFIPFFFSASILSTRIMFLFFLFSFCFHWCSNNHSGFMPLRTQCQSSRSGSHRCEKKDFFTNFSIRRRIAIGQPSFLYSSFLHSFILSFNSFIHSPAWLPHEYMDVLLLCWFQKERTYEQKGRIGGEVKSILYTQQRRRHTKTTHVGQKMGERGRNIYKKKKKERRKTGQPPFQSTVSKRLLCRFCMWVLWKHGEEKETAVTAATIGELNWMNCVWQC